MCICYCQLVLWGLRGNGGWGMKWPQDLPAAWREPDCQLLIWQELSSKDTHCSFKSFLLSLSCQPSVTWLAAWDPLLFVLTDSIPPYAELYGWKRAPFSVLLLKATGDILQHLLPQHSSPASLLRIRLSGRENYRMFSCLAARLNPAGLQDSVSLSSRHSHSLIFPFLQTIPHLSPSALVLGSVLSCCGSVFLKAALAEKAAERAACLPCRSVLEATSKIGLAPACVRTLREAKWGVHVLVFVRPAAMSERNRWAFGNKLFVLLKAHTDWKSIPLRFFSTRFSDFVWTLLSTSAFAGWSRRWQFLLSSSVRWLLPPISLTHHIFSFQPSRLEAFFINKGLRCWT